MRPNQADWLIIDGYSLIYRSPILAPLMDSNQRLARQQLIRQIEIASAKLPRRISIVFDGKGERIEVDQETVTFIEILFAPSQLTADSVIERKVYAHDQPSRILVVSSDRLERETVSASGAHTMACGDFLRWCQPPPPSRRASPGKDRAPKLGDLFPP